MLCNKCIYIISAIWLQLNYMRLRGNYILNFMSFTDSWVDIVNCKTRRKEKEISTSQRQSNGLFLIPAHSVTA